MRLVKLKAVQFSATIKRTETQRETKMFVLVRF